MASGTAICSLFRGMNIELIVVGKTDSAEVEALVAMYAKRINRYCKFAVTTIADVRNTRNMAASLRSWLSESIYITFTFLNDDLVGYKILVSKLFFFKYVNLLLALNVEI